MTMLRNLALAAAVATVPFTASAVTINAGSILPGSTNDVSAGPYLFSATFVDGDAAGIFDFEFTNTTLGLAAITLSEGTVLQNTLNFAGGVLVQWLNAGTSAFIPEGDTDGYDLTAIIPAGGSDTIRLTFGDPTAATPGGSGDIDFDILVTAIPLPASVLMLAGALGGLALLGKPRSA
jgi:hypothetical protein